MNPIPRRPPPSLLSRPLIAAVLLGVVAGVVAPAGAVVDPNLTDQWGLAKIGAPAAWTVATGEGVTIAVVDTGVDLDHEDLGGRVVGHVSCIGAEDDPTKCSGSGQDDHGHGTHVAGIATATTGNGRGVASVAPDARILAVKVLSPDGDGDASGSAGDVRAGIRWAVDHGADVINLSLGQEISIFSIFGTALDEAINDAWDAGVIPVVAAGNDSLFPSGYHNVDALVVTATDVNDAQASYASNVTAAQWGMAAPGGDGGDQAKWILSTWWQAGKPNAYGWAKGTSMAAPHVSGAAAVLLSLGLSPAETVDRILKTAKDLGVPGDDAEYGWGRLDVAAAVAGLGSPNTAEPVDDDPPAPSTPDPESPAPPQVHALAVAAPPPATVPARSTPRAPSPSPSVPAPTTPSLDEAPAPDGAVALAKPARSEGAGFGPLQFAGAAMLALAVWGLRATRRAAMGVAPR